MLKDSFRRRSSGSGWLMLCVCWACFISMTDALAQPLESAAYNKVQAAYIYKIANFVTWPDSELDSVFTICIVEKSESLAVVLRQATSSRNIQKLPVKVLSFSLTQLETVSPDVRQCRLIYLHDQLESKTMDSLHSAAVEDDPVLWISSPEVQADGSALFELEVEGG